jgi:hypothetical protein
VIFSVSPLGKGWVDYWKILKTAGIYMLIGFVVFLLFLNPATAAAK